MSGAGQRDRASNRRGNRNLRRSVDLVGTPIDGDATGVVRAGCAGDDDAVKYYADEGRATGGVEG